MRYDPTSGVEVGGEERQEGLDARDRCPEVGNNGNGKSSTHQRQGEALVRRYSLCENGEDDDQNVDWRLEGSVSKRKGHVCGSLDDGGGWTKVATKCTSAGATG